MNNWSNVMSYKMLTFQNCEIDTSSFGKYIENAEINNEKAFMLGNNAMKIKYDRVYYHNMNEWNQFMFGSDGFHYNVVDPSPNGMFKPDNPVIEKILTEMPYSSYDRPYKTDNLNHDVLTIYY